MAQYWPRVKAAIKNDESLASAVFVTQGGCPPLPHINTDRAGFHGPQFYEYWSTQANPTSVSTVVVAAHWEDYLLGRYSKNNRPAKTVTLLTVADKKADSADIERAWKGLEATVGSLVRSGKQVFILSSNPTSPTFGPLGVLHISGAGNCPASTYR